MTHLFRNGQRAGSSERLSLNVGWSFLASMRFRKSRLRLSKIITAGRGVVLFDYCTAEWTRLSLCNKSWVNRGCRTISPRARKTGRWQGSESGASDEPHISRLNLSFVVWSKDQYLMQGQRLLTNDDLGSQRLSTRPEACLLRLAILDISQPLRPIFTWIFRFWAKVVIFKWLSVHDHLMFPWSVESDVPRRGKFFRICRTASRLTLVKKFQALGSRA